MKAIDLELIEKESRQNENSRFLSGVTLSYPLFTSHLNFMPKTRDIQTHWVDVPSAVEVAPSNIVAKREISIIEKIKNFPNHYKYLGV